MATSILAVDQAVSPHTRLTRRESSCWWPYAWIFITGWWKTLPAGGTWAWAVTMVFAVFLPSLAAFKPTPSVLNSTFRDQSIHTYFSWWIVTFSERFHRKSVAFWPFSNQTEMIFEYQPGLEIGNRDHPWTHFDATNPMVVSEMTNEFLLKITFFKDWKCGIRVWE